MHRAGQIALPHLTLLLWLCVRCSHEISSGLGRWVLQELKQNLAKELDFRLEARNAQRLAVCMAGRRRVAIPEPVPQVSPSALVPSQTSALHSPAELAVSEEQLSHLTAFPVASMGFGLSHPFKSSEGHFWCMGTSAEMLACQQCQQGAAVEAH